MPVLRFVCAALLASAAASAATKVDTAALETEADARNWTGYGRTSGEARFSPLIEINRDTVARLNLAWSLDLDVGSAQSTPLAVDGVIYVAAGYSIVHAVDAKSGKLLWRFDPGVTKLAGKKLRAGGGIRGLAFSTGRLFVGTHDGRLLALDAKKGTQVWSVDSLNASDGSFISSAPREFNGKVAIGFGDSGATRGQVTTYDAATGKQLWRWQAQGGGGAVWNAMAFDAQGNRLLIGTGNARGSDAGGNRSACSVIALNADNGDVAWQYDSAPGDHLQCDNSTDITVATLMLDGQPRRVALHAPKQGTFQVLDLATGAALSSMTLGVGSHNQFAQAFSPKTNYAYVPTTDLPAENPDGTAAADAGKSALVAWDPIKQRPAWVVPTPGAFSGGVLATAGDLVFQGQADGYLTAYSAAEGRRVWAFFTAGAALGAPITFAIGKTQYVSILVGPPYGAPASLGTMSARFGWDSRAHPRRLLTFALDAKARLPPTPGPTFAKPLDGPDLNVDDVLVKEGAARFASCQWCHGAGAIAGGAAPDLRASLVPLVAPSFATLVRGGIEARGMPKFEEFSERELEALRHYIRARARLVTRPDGVAPVVPDVEPPPPVEGPTEDPGKPKERGPGDLQSEPPPRT